MSKRWLGLAERLRKARKPRGLTFITRHSRSIGKAPRRSSTKLNLTTKSFLLLGKLAALGRNYIRITVRAYPSVQGRKATPQTIRNLAP